MKSDAATPPYGLTVKVSPLMKGQKRAVQIDQTLYVSPAMWVLMTNADAEELKRLLANIPVIRLPGPDMLELRPLGMLQENPLRGDVFGKERS